MPFSGGRTRLGSSSIPFSIDDAFDIPEEEDLDLESDNNPQDSKTTTPSRNPILKTGSFRLELNSEPEETMAEKEQESRNKNGTGKYNQSILIFLPPSMN